MKKKHHLFIVASEKLYVRAEALMHWMVPIIDGLTVAFFGKDRSHPYLEIDTAIAWCRREMQFASKKRRKELETITTNLETVKRQFASGEAVIE